VVLVFNFTLIRLAPGDPITFLAGTDNPNPEQIAKLQAKYGLDKPIPIQLINYFKQLLQGDFGESFIHHIPVMDMVADRIWPTLMLSLVGAFGAVICGTLLGLLGVRKLGSWVDQVLSYISYILYSIPTFWLGLMFILLFATWLDIFPTSGMENVRANYTGFRHFLDVLHHLCMPAMTLIIVGIPTYYRIIKASMMQVLKDDYGNLFRAVGMPEKRIYNRYLFRNAILPTITTFGIRMAYILGGSAALEIVYAWPGMGRQTLNAITARDYNVLMATYFIMSCSIAIWMIVVDLLYAVVDPRIRYS